VTRDWITSTVADCLVPVPTGGKPKIQTRDYKAAGRFPIIDQGQERIAGWTDDHEAVIFSPLPLVVFGDHTRAFKFVETPFARGADGTQLLRPKDGIDPQFFFYACRSLDLPARGYNRHFSALKSMELAYPSDVDVQRAIASALVAIERASMHQLESIRIAQHLKQASMRKLFTHGLRNQPQKQTAIGPMPQDWEPRRLATLCEIWSGGTPSKSVPKYWNGEIPWVSGKDLKTPSLADAIDHISQEGVEEGSRLAPRDAVLLLVRGMGLAKDLPVAVITRPMAFNQDVKALVSRGGFSGGFLRSAIYAGKERLLSQIVRSAHGTMTLNLDDLERFEIACPADSTEASEVVEILDALDRKSELHEEKFDILDRIFTCVLRKLMRQELSVSALDLSALAQAATPRQVASS